MAIAYYNADALLSFQSNRQIYRISGSPTQRDGQNETFSRHSRVADEDGAIVLELEVWKVESVAGTVRR